MEMRYIRYVVLCSGLLTINILIQRVCMKHQSSNIAGDKRLWGGRFHRADWSLCEARGPRTQLSFDKRDLIFQMNDDLCLKCYSGT